MASDDKSEAMEVIIQSTLSTTQGRVIVATDPNETVDSLITAFCIEKGIRHRKNFVLHNKDLEVLINTRRLNTVGVQNGDVLFLGYKGMIYEQSCDSKFKILFIKFLSFEKYILQNIQIMVYSTILQDGAFHLGLNKIIPHAYKKSDKLMYI